MVGVDEACSGIRSFDATLMISLFLGELYRFGLLRRIGLVGFGVALAFGCNIVRTLILAWVSASLHFRRTKAPWLPEGPVA